MNTIKSVIDDASKKIGYIEASILMQYVLSEDKTYLIVNSDKVIDDNRIKMFNQLLEKIENGYPIQYITHRQEFMGLNFGVDENVLIPQPDTEILVEEAINILKDKIEEIATNYNKQNKNTASISQVKILDLCTGSGAIAISIANYLQKKIYSQKNDGAVVTMPITIIASDISKDALQIAKKNYENIILSNNPNEDTVHFIESDMFENIEDKFDIIVSNPPYIKTSEIKELNKDVQNEPHLALDGGEDGLKFYKVIKENMNKYLKPKGTLLMEIGHDQKADLLNMFEGSYCIKDLSGNDRVIIVQNNI